jgi:hypothetical protein
MLQAIRSFVNRLQHERWIVLPGLNLDGGQRLEEL